MIVEERSRECVLKSIEKFRRLALLKVCPERDAARTILGALVTTAEEHWHELIGHLEHNEIVAIDEYFEKKIRPHDYKPFPSEFMTDLNDQDRAIRIREELRPRYSQIDQLIVRALAAISGKLES